MASQVGKIFFRELNSLRFVGEDDDIYEWTCQIDRYFTLRDVPDEQRLSLVFHHLDGEALTWFQWWETNCLLTTWSNFLLNAKYRFGSSKLEDSEGRTLKLYQFESVADYQFQFDQAKVQEAEEEVNDVVVQEIKEASETEGFVKASEQPLDIEIQESKGAPEISKVSQKIMPMSFQKGNEDKGLVCEGLICHVNVTKAQAQNDKSTGMSEYVQFFHIYGKHDKGMMCQDGLWIDSSYKMNKHLFGCMFAVVARRGSILKFYALEEIYKEFSYLDTQTL